MLHIQHINQYYGQSHILWDLSLNLKQGTCGCLIGRNGVGKTTLLKCITGLLPVRDGQLQFDSQDISKLSTEARARRYRLRAPRAGNFPAVDRGRKPENFPRRPQR